MTVTNTSHFTTQRLTETGVSGTRKGARGQDDAGLRNVYRDSVQNGERVLLVA